MRVLVGAVACWFLAWASAPRAAIASPGCETSAVIFRAGVAGDSLCDPEVRAQKLTVLDLSSEWVPFALAPDAEGNGPEYMHSYVALADERYADATRDRYAAARDGYLEIYGVLPSLRVLRSRLGDEVRHRCHDAVDDQALQTMRRPLTVESTAVANRRIRDARRLRVALTQQVRKRQLVDIRELADTSTYYRKKVQRLVEFDERIARRCSAWSSSTSVSQR